MSALSDLTWVEEKLIARVHVSIQILICREPRKWRADKFYPQRMLKGNMSTFPIDPTVLLNKLPLRGEDVAGLVKVVFMSSRKRISIRDASRLRFFVVRRKKVEAALRWLIANNSLYANVEVDEEALSRLPEDGMIPEVYETITFCDKVSEDLAGHSRYDDPDDGTIDILHLRRCLTENRLSRFRR